MHVLRTTADTMYVQTQQAPDEKGTGHNITSRIPTVSEKIGDGNSVSKMSCMLRTLKPMSHQRHQGHKLKRHNSS